MEGKNVEVFDWAAHAPDLAVPGPVPGGALVVRAERPPVVIPANVAVHYAPDGTPVYVQRPAEPVGQRRDVWPARLLCGGVGGGALCAGAGYMFREIAAATVGLGFVFGSLLLVWLIKGSRSSGGGHSLSIKGDGNRVQIR